MSEQSGFDLSVENIKLNGCASISVQLSTKGSDYAQRFQIPGQYCKIKSTSAEGYFAIASKPDSAAQNFEFLIKSDSRLGVELTNENIGKLHVSPPTGKGFSMTHAIGKDVWLISTGTGISPMRSLILSMLDNRAKHCNITLYWGSRTPDAFAFGNEISAWQNAGIEIRRTVSAPTSDWRGLHGYVQHHLPKAPSPSTVVYACGQKEMIHDVKHFMAANQMPAENLMLNY